MSGPRPGDFTAVRTNGRIGLGIRLMTKSSTNHVITYYGEAQVGEADPGGYRIVPLSNYAGHTLNWSTDRFPLTPAQSITARATMRRFADARDGRGVPYNFLDIGCLFLALLFGRHLPLMVRRRLARPDWLMCSQAADLIDQAMGVQLFDDGRLAGDVTPGDLDRLVTGRP